MTLSEIVTLWIFGGWLYAFPLLLYATMRDLNELTLLDLVQLILGSFVPFFRELIIAYLYWDSEMDIVIWRRK